VWLLVFSSPLGILSLRCSPPLLIANSTPAIPMAHERGKPKRGPTYYNFMARQCRPGPSSAPLPPPLSDPGSAGPSSGNLPFIDQNWMEDDKDMVFVEEEFPLVPPQAPLDSLLFSASYLHAPLHNSA
jgi:hypothetical protein